MKRKKLLVTVLIIAVFLLVSGYIVYNFIDYGSVKTKNEFSQNESEIIRSEYHLCDDAHIEYVFTQGGDMYGVRVRLTEADKNADIDSMVNNIFNCNINMTCDSERFSDKTIQYYSENDKMCQYRTSSGIENTVPMTGYVSTLNELTGK